MWPNVLWEPKWFSYGISTTSFTVSQCNDLTLTRLPFKSSKYCRVIGCLHNVRHTAWIMNSWLIAPAVKNSFHENNYKVRIRRPRNRSAKARLLFAWHWAVILMRFSDMDYTGFILKSWRKSFFNLGNYPNEENTETKESLFTTGREKSVRREVSTQNHLHISRSQQSYQLERWIRLHQLNKRSIWHQA